VRGVAWTAGIKWGSQGLSWFATILVARLLTPEDYGLFGMATMFLGLITLLTEFGISAAVLTFRDLTQSQLRQLNGLAVMLGVGGFIVSVLIAVPLSIMFHSPPLVAVVCAVSTTFIIGSFRSIPMALLQRQLRFRTVALLDGVHAVIMPILWIVFAYAGLRYWTLVLGAVAGSAVATALTLMVSRVGFAMPRRAHLAAALTMSRDVVVGRICWYIYSNADFMVAGRVLGKAALGGYSYAWMIASLPVEKITALVGRVTPGVFSAVQDDLRGLRRYFLTVTEALAVITFPAAAGLGIVAGDFVRVVLGDQWLSAIIPLQILAFYATVRSITPLLTQVLNIRKETRFVMWTSVASAILLPAAFVIGSRWGVTGIALTWVLVHPILLVPLYVRAFQCMELKAIEYVRVLAPPVGSTLLMVLAVATAARVLPMEIGPMRLAAQVLVGVVTYTASLHLMHPEGLSRFRRVLASARN
jgi:PST family polysaccharide transporter